MDNYIINQLILQLHEEIQEEGCDKHLKPISDALNKYIEENHLDYE